MFGKIFHLRTRNILVRLFFWNIKYFFDSWSFISSATDLKFPRFVLTKHFPSRNIFLLFFKIPRSEVIYAADVQKTRSLCIAWKWSFPLPSLTTATQPCNKVINLSTPRQCLHVSDFLEQIFQTFPNSCFISSHLLEHDNLLSSNYFEAKAIWRLFIASENPSNWFMSVIFIKSIPFFNSIC